MELEHGGMFVARYRCAVLAPISGSVLGRAATGIGEDYAGQRCASHHTRCNESTYVSVHIGSDSVYMDDRRLVSCKKASTSRFWGRWLI
jgi:hypothetical protein